MVNLIINSTVYHQGNQDSSLEEIRFNDWIQSGKKMIDQDNQSHANDEYEAAVADLIEKVSQKIRFNMNPYGIYQGTPIQSQNGVEYIRHCLGLEELENLSIEEFRYISDRKLSKSNTFNFLTQTPKISSNLNILSLLPRTGTSEPPSIQVSWKSIY